MSMSKGPPVCGRGLSSCMSMSKGPLVRPCCLFLFGLGIIPCHMLHKTLFMINADNVFIYVSPIPSRPGCFGQCHAVGGCCESINQSSLSGVGVVQTLLW